MGVDEELGAEVVPDTVVVGEVGTVVVDAGAEVLAAPGLFKSTRFRTW